MHEDDLMTAIQVAEYVGVSRTTVYDWAKEGPPKGLKHFKTGKTALFVKEWVHESERAMAKLEKKEVSKGVNANEEGIQCVNNAGDRR